MKRLSIIIFILCLISASISWGATYNVGPGETDLTITACLARVNVNAGDTIQLTSNITDRVTDWPTGDIGASGNPVIIDFGGFTINANGGNGIYLAAGRSYLKFQSGTISGNSNVGVYVDAQSGDITEITLYNLTITGFSSHGVYFLVRNDHTLHTVTVDDCTIYSNGGSGIDCLYGDGDAGVTSTFHTVTFTDNSIHDNGRWGIRLQCHVDDTNKQHAYGIIIGGSSGHGNDVYDNTGAGIRFYGGTDTSLNKISYNTVYGNCTGDSQTVGGIWLGEVKDATLIEYNNVYNNHSTSIDGVGIYSDVGCDDTIIRYNRISAHTDQQLNSNTDSAGIAIGPDADDVLVYGNVIFDNWIGIRCGASTTANLKIYNNTFVNNARAQIKLQNSLPAPTIYNNIGYGGDYGIWENANNPTEDYNNMYGAGTANYQGFSKGANSTEVDPLFVNLAGDNFELSNASPCIDDGTNTPGVSFDDGIKPGSSWTDSVTLLDRDLYGAAWDMGAYECDLFITDASPADEDMGVSVDIDITWTNPTGTNTVDVYFDEDEVSCPPGSPTQVSTGSLETNYNPPGSLGYDKKCCWRVDILHAGGTQTGVDYEFTTTTEQNPPTPAGSVMSYHKNGVMGTYHKSGVSIE